MRIIDKQILQVKCITRAQTDVHTFSNQASMITAKNGDEAMVQNTIQSKHLQINFTLNTLDSLANTKALTSIQASRSQRELHNIKHTIVRRAYLVVVATAGAVTSCWAAE